MEERATAEQSRTEMIAYQREVRSWGICVLLRLCVLSLLNLYCVYQASEQRGAGQISAIQQLDDTLLILSAILSFLYTAPISHLLNFLFPLLFYLRDRGLKAVSISEYPSFLAIVLDIKNWIWAGRSAQKVLVGCTKKPVGSVNALATDK